MKQLSHPYLHATFCDDVRQEVTGKMLYVGVYSCELITSAYPVLLPKLAVIAHYAYPFEDQPGAGAVTAQSISLMLDDEELLELPRFDAPATSPTVDEGSRGRLMTFMMNMAPFQLSRPGRLRVKIKCVDGSELLSNALTCRLPTEAELTAP
jgi:hypothetical protein